MASVYNIAIKRGATFRRKIRLTDQNGAPINLTATIPVMRLIPAGAEVIDLNPSNGKLVVSNAANGEMEVFIQDEETGTYTTWRKGKYYLNVGFSNGDVIDYLEGAVTLTNLGG